MSQAVRIFLVIVILILLVISILSYGDHGVTGASLLVRQKARGRHPLVTPISVRRPSKRTAAAATRVCRERYPGWTPLFQTRNSERGARNGESVESRVTD